MQVPVPQHFADMPVPQILDEIVEVLKLDPQERVQKPTVEHALSSQFLEETVQVVLAPIERGHRRSDEQIVELPTPTILEDIVEVVRRAPHERVQQRTPEHSVNVSFPQERAVPFMKDVPKSSRRES